LIVRGANVDYVNRNGNTALHLLIENNTFSENGSKNMNGSMIDAIAFLLKKGANPHLMDLNNEDACEKAKKNGVAIIIP
jgi:ankyrin repeat protein